MRRALMRPAALALAACAALAGCGIRSTGIISAGDPPLAQGHTATITVYLVRNGKLVAVARPGLPGEPNLAMQQLTVPPTERERKMGLHTDVRPDLVTYSVAAVSSPVDRRAQMVVRPSGQGAAPAKFSRMAKAQLACTARAVQGIHLLVLQTRRDPDRHTWEYLTCRQFSDLLE